MRTAVFLLLVALLPISVAAQTPVAAQQARDTAATAQVDDTSRDWMVPLWRRADGSGLRLNATTRTLATERATASSAWMFAPGARATETALDWSPSKRTSAELGVRSVGAARATPCVGTLVCNGARHDPNRWNGGEFRGAYHFNAFTIGVGASWTEHAGAAQRLPSVLPEADVGLLRAPGAVGSWVDSVGAFNASGSMRLGPRATVDVAASVGRLRMLPGNDAGLGAIDQQSLSLGLGAGPISGSIVGRVMQPIPGASGLIKSMQRWSAVDLGVTVRFPWEGELSLGAQNLWSSGHAPVPTSPAANEAVQGRVPYIQYHQEL